jgi:glycosyltransferase involved in cell wall biosynthesis
VPELAEQQLPDSRERVTAAPAADRLDGRRFTMVMAWATLGGAERNALRLARHLAHDRGASVEVCSLTEQDGEAPRQFVESGIPWRPLPFEWPAGRVAKTRALSSFAWGLRRLSPDILMPFCSRPNILCGLAWRATGASLCVWHQRDVIPVTRFSPTLVRRAARSTPLFMSNSEHGIEHLVATVGAARERVHYGPSAVELAAAREDRETWRRRCDARDEDFLACMIAHLREGKDYETLLRAWQIVCGRLADVGQRAVLVFAGTGPAEVAAKAVAFDLGLVRTVRFLGHVDDVGGLIHACDAGVLSSLGEGCPQGILECMAAGLPVAGTDIPGIREAVGPDGFAYLAPPADAEALAAALARLADDPQERRVLGEQNARRVRTQFSLSRMLEAHTGVLERELARRNG